MIALVRAAWRRGPDRLATGLALGCRSLTVAAELAAVTVASSLALRADLFHNAFELVPEIALYLVTRLKLTAIRRRLERSIPWIVRAVMLVTAGWIAVEALRAVLGGSEAAHGPAGAVGAVAALLGAVLNRVAAAALAAAAPLVDGHVATGLVTEAGHLRVDARAGAVACVGILLSQLGVAWWFDPLAAIYIAGSLVLEVARSFGHHQHAAAARTSVRSLWPLMRLQRARISWVVALAVVAAGFGVVAPLVVGSVIERWQELEAGQLEALCLLAGLAYLAAVAVEVLGQVLAGAAADLTADDLRRRVWRRVTGAALRHPDDVSAGSGHATLTGHVDAVRDAIVRTLPMAASDLATLIVTAVAAFVVDRSLAPLLLVAVAVLVPLQRLTTSRRRDAVRRHSEALTTVHDMATLWLNQAAAVFARIERGEEALARRFVVASARLAEAGARATLWGAVAFGLGSAAIAVMYVVTLVGGWHLSLSRGEVLALWAMQSRLFYPAAGIFGRFAELVEAAERSRPVAAWLERAPEPRGSLRPAGVSGRFSLSGVSFGSGSGRAALDGVSLELPAGRLLVVAGGSGAGKTTLLSLLAGLHHPSAGRITLDGHDLRELDPDALAAVVGFVPSDPYIPEGAVAGTLSPFAEHGPDELFDALRQVGMYGWVRRLPEGLDTIVGRARRLSTGERLRLATARELVKRPPVLILDEPTTGLDPLAVAQLVELLTRMRKRGMTLIVATHDRLVARFADEVIMLRAGRVVQRGAPDTLRKQPGGAYAQLDGIADRLGDPETLA